MTEAAYILEEESATLPELLLGLWLESLEMEGRGYWLIADGAREFVLEQSERVVFLFGATPEGGLFLGVGPEVSGWFLDLDWRYVQCKDNSMRLCLHYEDDDFFLVVPLERKTYEALPSGRGKIELSELETYEAGDGVTEYDRTRTRKIPYHKGGDK